jgi:hypothetical protein
VSILLSDSRVDSSVDDNFAIYFTSALSYINIVRLLLSDPRINIALCDIPILQETSNELIQVYSINLPEDFIEDIIEIFSNKNIMIRF